MTTIDNRVLGPFATRAGVKRNRPMNHESQSMRQALANPDHAIRDLDRADSSDSLMDFIRLHWATLEPKRKLVTGWSLDAMIEHLQAVERGQIRKLLMNVPPGWMKSMSTNVFFPAWVWGPRNRPDVRFIGASYSQALTLRDNRRCRQLIADPYYQALWGDRFSIMPDQDTKSKFENDKRGWKIATSVGGSVVGERGDIFIIDDPHNIKDGESDAVRERTLQWFTEIVPSRVNDPDKSAFIVIMQRVARDDVSGLILAKELGYEHLCMPMEYEDDHPFPSRTFFDFKDPRSRDGELLWPERYSPNAVEELKKSLRAWGGDYAVAGQLQQRPAPRGGGMFKKSWWRFFRTEANETFGPVAPRPAGCWDGDAVELPSAMDWGVLSVDCAFKDKTTGSRVAQLVITSSGPFIFVRDNVTDFMDFKKTVDTMATFDEKSELSGGLLHKWEDEIDGALVEDKANGSAVINTLYGLIAGVVAINPEGGKQSRASAIVLAVQSGHVLLPDGAPWVDDFVDEFSNFPVGGRNDQVDSLSQAMIYMTENRDELRAMWMTNL